MSRNTGSKRRLAHILPTRSAFLVGLVLLLSLILVMVGCGGGTTGTGGSGSDEFAGRILSISGDPIVEATVTIEETGDSTVTDNNGEFMIEASGATPLQATLLVETATAQSSVVVDELPDIPARIEVSLKLNEKNNILEVTSKKVTSKKKKPTPQATPLANVPSVTPTPIVQTPVPSIEVTPTATLPLATPTLVDSPSVSPSISPTISATPTPTSLPIPTLAIIRGIVHVSDPDLLVDARIGFLGESRRAKIQSNGTFFFRATPVPGAILVIKSGHLTGRLVLDGITDRAEKVILGLELNRGAAENLSIALSSIRIIEGTVSRPILEPGDAELVP